MVWLKIFFIVLLWNCKVLQSVAKVPKQLSYSLTTYGRTQRTFTFFHNHKTHSSSGVVNITPFTTIFAISASAKSFFSTHNSNSHTLFRFRNLPQSSFRRVSIKKTKSLTTKMISYGANIAPNCSSVLLNKPVTDSFSHNQLMCP